jgi:hypothetical protein
MLSADTILYPAEAFRQGMKDGSVREGLNPIEVAIFMSTVGESIVKLSPKKAKLLESHGIDRESFIRDAMRFMGIMVINRDRV